MSEMGNIRNMDAFRASIWDWSWLNGAFGDKIRVTDIDGMVERCGNFLMIEGKKGGTVAGGQQFMFDAWVANGNSLLLLSGMDHSDQNMVIMMRGGPWPAKPSTTQGNRETVRYICSTWYKWANAHPKQTRN